MNRVTQRLVMPLAVVTAVGMIVVWFPFSTLLSQRTQMNGVAQQIALLHQQGHVLQVQQKALSTAQATEELARQEYQLVQPGQRLIQVLNNGDGTAGDPGDSPLASPLGTSGVTSSSQHSVHHGAGFWSRVVHTLEFWR